jgi:hypothetical protein
MSAAPGTDTRPLDVIHELLATTAGVEKPGARATSIEDAQQLLDNRYGSSGTRDAGGDGAKGPPAVS